MDLCIHTAVYISAIQPDGRTIDGAINERLHCINYRRVTYPSQPRLDTSGDPPSFLHPRVLSRLSAVKGKHVIRKNPEREFANETKSIDSILKIEKKTTFRGRMP